jgi:hypothetical protein
MMVGTVVKRRLGVWTAVVVAVALFATTPTAARADVAPAPVDPTANAVASEPVGSAADAGPDAASVDPVAVPAVAVTNA